LVLSKRTHLQACQGCLGAARKLLTVAFPTVLAKLKHFINAEDIFPTEQLLELEPQSIVVIGGLGID